MTLRLPDHWVWDFWFAEEGGRVHVFFLHASRALGDPELRHRHARLGHAVSDDLRTWMLLPDPLPEATAGAFDDLAIWTGSVLRGADAWYLLYTGLSTRDHGRVQRTGLAVSADLERFERVGPGPVIDADARWYEVDGGGPQGHVAWRDPYLFADPGGDGYHALLTARSAQGPAGSRGVIGHLVSRDLQRWTARPPIAGPAGFAELEVPQVVDVGGSALLLFSTSEAHMSDERRRHHDGPIPSGTFVCRGPGLLGPFDVPESTPLLPVSRLYSGKLIQRDGTWSLLGFIDRPDGRFVGELSDPQPFDPAAAVPSGPANRRPR